MCQNCSKELAKTYDPKSIEDRLYKKWEDNGYFHAEVDRSKKPFTIVMPPPNITGQLHMGHALDNTMQDILTRYKRMQGYNALWQPGTDHASIATEVKVIQSLKEKGIDKADLGREGFLEKCWEWREEYGNRIINQLKKLGSSADWHRERFTMDKGCSDAVQEVFIKLYQKGYIYKGSRIVNWCPVCKTSISDAEVEHEEQDGFFWHINYPVVGEEGRFVEIATTRPETLFGDTAVAVNPDDERYKDIVGKMLKLPMTDREIPVIADPYVDKEFGTGCVKITPAHDPNDFEVGKRHNLEEIVVINDDATMNKLAGKYEGMDRYECRKALVKDLEEAGLIVKVVPHSHNVGVHDRCHTTVEPMIKQQWFVKMDEMIKPAVEGVKNGDIKLLPKRMDKTYFNWTDNIRDWCISRQIWWGHRIPVWYCDDCGEMSASRTDLTVCPKCGSAHIHQDEDALDTWFSSALWPFSTMGWPDKTPLLKQFYPTSVLVTGYDIIFFWVARMLIMGMEFMHEIPFDKVFIHGLVRDSQGRKMSKSLGNGIDPLEVIDQYGADTLRFMLITGNTPGNDMRFYWERVEATRNFANKIWNASRFALMNMEGYDANAKLAPYTLADKWILSRLQHTAKSVTEMLEKFELGEAGRMIYDFIWGEVCDWYIELAKPRLYNKENAEERATAQHVLATVLTSAMQLLHPYMPFITEEIYQCLPHEAESIMISKWPEADEALMDDEAERLMGAIMESIKAIRNMRAEVNVPPGKKVPATMLAAADLKDGIEANADYIHLMGAISELTVLADNAAKPENAMAAVVAGIEVYLPLAGLIDVEKENARLNKELAAIDKELSRVEGKLGNAGFLAKAPEAVIEKEKAKAEELNGKKAAINERLEYLKTL